MRKVLLMVVAALVTLMVAMGTASASTSGVQPGFEAQARAAGLSSAQAAQLQQKVNSYIHAHGGTQVALNAVELPGGKTKIEFAVPGEKYARDLGAAAPIVACPSSGTFCAYSNGFYQGDVMMFTTCSELAMPFSGEGSYINHLVTGRTATWYDYNGHVVYITPPAPSNNQEVNWAPVFTVRPCTGTASASTTGVQPGFEAQARAAGLSSAQAAQLQQKVNSYIHAHGGTQVALNAVELPGGRNKIGTKIEFAVPGGKHARALGAAPIVACPSSGTFCAYSNGFYQGDVLMFTTCSELGMPFLLEGSYINHLVKGRTATWYDSNGDVVYITPPAPSNNQEVNWAPVASVRPCT